ncbi:Choline/ethanolaminephosphotransferase [Backusella circina FSU 941]|nr:Choline/ethanolaminephosphotransferase [Backusella circina FSU 941]
MTESNILSQEQLSNLKLYKYASVDKSYLSRYILRHYWDWAIEYFPINMAPNLITLTGLLFMILNVILVFIYVPTFEPEDAGPWWLYVSFSLGLWLYSTFDNVDGRQARRTGTSSPLGELFDHGCDALNCSFAALIQMSAMGLGHTKQAVIIFVIATAGFYLSTIEEYHTGVLYLGYVNVPTEGVSILCIMYLFSAAYGPGVWQNTLGSILPFLPESLANQTLKDTYIWVVAILFTLTHVPVCFYAMYKACERKGVPYIRTMLYDNWPIALYTVAFYSWATSPYSFILSHQYYGMFLLAAGMVFGRLCSKIILAHLTKSESPLPSVLLIPLVVGALVANLPGVLTFEPIFTPESEYLYICVYFIVSLVTYIHWAVRVIDSICTYLGISCLTIPEQKKGI